FKGETLQSNFSLKRCAFQTIRPVVSRKKRGFSAHSGPGGAVPPPRVFPFFKGENALKKFSGKRGGEFEGRGAPLKKKPLSPLNDAFLTP
ncbi:MAG: hypothetical protein MSH25_02945, partial [Desulfovibrio sp.]|uniref:hypothetical protein n=1 Tax=Desulfovibrio sp. TaxID=885 RepID=UPI0025C1DE2D